MAQRKEKQSKTSTPSQYRDFRDVEDVLPLFLCSERLVAFVCRRERIFVDAKAKSLSLKGRGG